MSQKKKLRLGKMKTQQIADWMGITYSSFRKKKKEDRFKQLEDYCEFEEIYGGINVLKIYEYEYSKKGSLSKQTIMKNFDNTWSSNGLDTCKRVGAQIQIKYNLPIVPETAAKYAAQGRNLFYGKPYKKDDWGKNGKCNYVLCKVEGEGVDTKYIRFTPEEEQIKNRLFKQYFGNVDEKAIIVKAMVEAGEIKKEEAWEVLQEMTNMYRGNYVAFLFELQATLECKVIKATEVEKYMIDSAF